MIKLTTNMIEESAKVNGGFLAVSLAIVIASLSTPIEGGLLFPLILCCISIPPLAFNAFIIEYKKRFKLDLNSKKYDTMVVSGFSCSVLGLVFALLFKSLWLVIAFFLGICLTGLSISYLDNLVKYNEGGQPDK